MATFCTILWPSAVQFAMIIHAAVWSVVAGVMCALQLKGGHQQALGGVFLYPILFTYCAVWCCKFRSDNFLVSSKADMLATIMWGVSSLVLCIWNTWFCSGPAVAFLMLSLVLSVYVATRNVADRWNNSVHSLALMEDDLSSLELDSYILPMTVHDDNSHSVAPLILRQCVVTEIWRQEQAEAATRDLATLMARNDLASNAQAMADLNRCLKAITETRLGELRHMAPKFAGDAAEDNPTKLTADVLAGHNAVQSGNAAQEQAAVEAQEQPGR
ncbi:hypothetical protein CspeluHIS016_0602750 [Cutaneotrichosporon spelunceum]|uniref:Transmembrane protein n=1 Tax=Cutaneotrichosporon spelunceum TaxID=1672016 RepID=A0AAD3TY03_9TREE|nr:hypothetical protein CspeluHIS016_0602750 [Cutaneotrichosporon spelunceum]